MEYFKTAVNGLELSRVGVGTWAMGGGNWGLTEEKPAIEAIHKALEMGINVIDTAPVYGFGVSEEIVGKALSQSDYRSKAVLVSKCGLSWDKQGNVFRDSRPETIRKEIEASLKRLQTDYLDVYLIHWPDIKVPFEETANVMNEFLQKGLIRAVGVSNMSIDQMNEWKKFAPLHAIEPSFNILENKLFENQIPFAKENHVAVFGYSSLSRGMLSGKYFVGMKFNEGDMRGKDDPKYQGQDFINHIAAVDELKVYAENLGKTVSQLAVRWVLDRGVSTALWGIRKPDQLEPISGVMGWSLTSEQMDEMEAIVAKHVPVQVNKEFLTPPYRE